MESVNSVGFGYYWCFGRLFVYDGGVGVGDGGVGIFWCFSKVGECLL